MFEQLVVSTPLIKFILVRLERPTPNGHYATTKGTYYIGMFLL